MGDGKFLKILIAASFVAMVGKSFAQDSLSVVILSPRVGAVIDAKERDRYRLFWDLEQFDSAVVLRNTVGSYVLYVMGMGVRQHSKDTSLSVPALLLFKYSEKIDHINEIENQTYHAGSNFPSLQILKGKYARVDRAITSVDATSVDTVISAQSQYSDWPTAQYIVRERGRTTNVITTSGKRIAGELLAVRSNAVVLNTQTAIQDTLLIKHHEFIQSVPLADILTIHLERESNIGKGLGIGLFSGAVAGILLGYGGGDDPPGWFSMTAGQKAALGGFVCGLTGMLVGTIVGATSSTHAIDIEYPDSNALVKLKSGARFPEDEPDWLKQFDGDTAND